MNASATLNFPNRQLAIVFATAWGRYSARGHDMGAGKENVKVTIYEVTDEDRKWIENWIKSNS